MFHPVAKTMAKTITLMVVLLGLTQLAQAQRQLGGGVVFGTGSDDIGLGLRARFPVGDKVFLVPGIDFMEFGENRHFVAINGDVHYDFKIEENFYAYPLAGLTLGIRDRATQSRWGDDELELGINLGGGGLYYFTPEIAGMMELKAVVGGFEQLILTLGVLVSI